MGVWPCSNSSCSVLHAHPGKAGTMWSCLTFILCPFPTLINSHRTSLPGELRPAHDAPSLGFIVIVVNQGDNNNNAIDNAINHVMYDILQGVGSEDGCGEFQQCCTVEALCSGSPANPAVSFRVKNFAHLLLCVYLCTILQHRLATCKHCHTSLRHIKTLSLVQAPYIAWSVHIRCEMIHLM